MSADDRSAWALVPWTPVADDETGKAIGWRKQHVPYVAGGVSLQTLDVWIPAAPPSGATVIDAASLPSRPGHWLVFVHGGAWCDPGISSSAISAAAKRLLRGTVDPGPGSGPDPGPSLDSVAGVASLNYRLSPNQDPSSDPARQAKHPDHISDVLAGISFLQRLGAATGPYVLSGHSCGAMLAFQAVMDPARWGLSTTIAKPAVLLGLNGLYDLAGFIGDTPPGFEWLRDDYVAFTRNAFGHDESVWKTACPATATWWPDEWSEGRRVVLVQSSGDTLVPYSQLEKMRAYLKKSPSLQVDEKDATGGHDALWVEGDRLAEIFSEIMSEL
ncbi:Alpha/Beta hydrolase protein [Lasiosphaeria ovina]|uniref:Kynurenine formamidase n=1 Tax=Lasiosphaeria ovina TaxID=92902 RepID=A0AAE0K6Z8_9PEZI|nr:Alpha/Beta hydrolase protein [Lasiosphaeria ovina]